MIATILASGDYLHLSDGTKRRLVAYSEYPGDLVVTKTSASGALFGKAELLSTLSDNQKRELIEAKLAQTQSKSIESVHKGEGFEVISDSDKNIVYFKFDAKPGYFTLGELKQNKYKWDPHFQFWYLPLSKFDQAKFDILLKQITSDIEELPKEHLLEKIRNKISNEEDWPHVDRLGLELDADTEAAMSERTIEGKLNLEADLLSLDKLRELNQLLDSN